MKIKNIAVVALLGLVLAGCGHKKQQDPQGAESRQLINAMAVKDRPYVAVFPHPTNKLITLFFDKKGDIKNISTEIEYLSGNALKGGRSSINSSSNPYTQAFLLGSCSAGGKCSFDTDITTGTIKTKFELGSEIHVLKSNYVFISPTSESTTDQKMSFKPEGKSKATLVLSGNHGLIGEVAGEIVGEPVSILSSNSDLVAGKLRIVAFGATKAWIYDGSAYKEIKFVEDNGAAVIALNQKPFERKVNIVRDDLKGSSENASLFAIGPVVLTKN